VRFIERPFCERLGTPFALDFGNEGLLSPEAVADPPVFARARAVAHFEDGPVHRLKYKWNLPNLSGHGSRASATIFWPRPIFSCRFPCTAAALPRAGQAHALAQAIAAQCGVPADPFVLARVKPTPS
jgi:hypothetical protein